MTKKERAIADRFWLRIRKFAVTNSLLAKLAVSGLSLEEQEWCCFIMNLVVVGTRKDQQAQILATTIKEKIRGKYTTYIKLLMDWGELDTTGHFTPPCGDKAGEARKYWIPLAARESGIVIKDFKVGRVRATKDDSQWQPHEPWIGYIRECMSQISVAKELRKIDSPAEDALIHESAKKVFHGDFGCHRGKESHRLYHTIIEMLKEGRANLIWKATGKPVDGEYDVKSCHAVLLLTLASDSKEAALYCKVLDYDIYDFIRISQKIKDTRQGCKDEWMDFVNHPSTKETTFKSNYVFQFYSKNFPQLTSAIVGRSDMALRLQNLEASIMVDSVGKFCLEKNIWYIPMHDGFLCQDKDLTEVKQFVVDQFKLLTGYEINITFKSFDSYINNTLSSPIHHMMEYKPPKELHTRWNQACEEYNQLYTTDQLEEEYKKRLEAKQRGMQWKAIQNRDAAKWKGLSGKYDELMN